MEKAGEMLKGIGYSLLTVKTVNEEKRIISGMATTPTPDRVGDIIEPKGAKFANPLPLLWMHDHSQPVGTVTFGKATDAGIPFEATIANIRTPQPLSDRLDECWQLVKNQIVRGVSIGFRALEYSFMEEGGVRFIETEIYELSCVTVPANAEATIETIKSLDREFLKTGAPAVKEQPAKVIKTAGASAQPVKLSIKPKEEKTMNISEELKQAKATRTDKFDAMKLLMSQATEKGETLSGAGAEQYDQLDTEVNGLDQHIKRLEKLAEAESTTATVVSENGKGANSSEEGSRARGGSSVQVTSMIDREEKGLGMARLVRAIGMAKGNLVHAESIAKEKFKHDPRIANILKAVVAAGTTLDNTWAGPLVGEESKVFADFVEFLRPQTILGRFGANGIPGLRRVPFRTRLVGQTSGGSANWVGEGKGKPVTKFDFNNTTLEPLKVAAISVITMELLRDSSPAADTLVRDQLVAACRERLDLDFIDPAKAASAGVSPASITNAATHFSASGNDADAVRNDIKRLLGTYIAANNAPTSGVLIMSSMMALAISIMRNAFGQKEFPDLNMNGGTVEGIPVITSEYVPADSSGSLIIMVNAQDIWLGDNGDFTVDMSNEASIEMSDAPTQNSTTPTAASMVSMFQTNSVAFRAERTINWAKRRNSAVAYIDSAFYGDAS